MFNFIVAYKMLTLFKYSMVKNLNHYKKLRLRGMEFRNALLIWYGI